MDPFYIYNTPFVNVPCSWSNNFALPLPYALHRYPIKGRLRVYMVHHELRPRERGQLQSRPAHLHPPSSFIFGLQLAD